MKKFSFISAAMKAAIPAFVLTLALFTTGCASTAPASDPPTDTIVPGLGLASKLAWLQKNVKSNNTFILELSSNG